MSPSFSNAAFQTEGKLYLILDFLRGGDLFTRLSKEVSRKILTLEKKFYSQFSETSEAGGNDKGL